MLPPHGVWVIEATVRSTFEPSMLASIDVASVTIDAVYFSSAAIVLLFCRFLFNNGTPAYICDRIGKETGKGTEP